MSRSRIYALQFWVLFVIFGAISGSAALGVEAVPPGAACEALVGGRMHDIPGAATEVVSAKYVPASADRRSYCAIEGYVNPEVNFGMLLPAEGWNGRYIVRGCGGSCGAVYTELACGRHVRDGFACLTTDMGHRSTLQDNNWVAGNLQGLIDFGYRATHVATMAGQALIEAYYQRKPAKSYFFGCSTGGRQGMIEAQRFPGDFDGIIAIAPASMGPFGTAEVVDPKTYNHDEAGRQIMVNRKLLLVHRAVERRCAGQDGVADGLIADPRQCLFDPAELQCRGDDNSDCLSADQVAIVRRIYRERGAQPGSELNWIGNYIANAPLEGEAAQRAVPPQGRGDPIVVETTINAANPDLRAFRNHGGKLILVHGWDDPSVPPLPTIDYFETMQKTMDGPKATAEFARLFMIPGMDHCSGGSGAYSIDYVTALIAWVEQGKAPDKLIGYHPKPDAPIDFFGIDLPRVDKSWFVFSRPHYSYPRIAVYDRTGDPHDFENFIAR